MRVRNLPRLLKFGVVGSSGLVVDTFFLWFFTEIAGLYYLVSSPLATELSILSNFLLNNFWTFRQSSDPSGLFPRMLKFHVTSVAGFVIKFTILIGLTKLAGLHYLIANVVGVLVAFAWNYAINVHWTWRD